ncbi:putative phospholipase, SCC2/Nipped-B family [Lupinus albus]|uniref:Putative phospholipase, SCC2/Nipped-B family n=1 Tax=Lupinus albus TaxID=3870 RepID=A0A6A4Q809_LUPAL|nr:putative phospholipase, SCC2/Nipped-B family [Lupinus albus]
MALNGRVNLKCGNVSNPYHQCTQACMQKSNPHRNNKTSSFGRSVTDGELGKKTSGVRRRYPDCTKASNPYHHCDENCNKRLSNSDVAPSTFDRKKKLGSKPEPPALDSVPASKIGAIYLSAASSPISHYPENKNVDQSVEHIPSKHIPEEIHVQDIMHVYQKDQLNTTETNEGDNVACQKVVPIPNVDDTTVQGETKSVVSETPTRIPVGSYHVKESFGPILQSILDKYGDIGATCHLESHVIRSYYIECVCFVVQELQSSSIIELRNSKVKELLDILKDVEYAQLHVAWLRSILDEIAENIELIDQNQDVKVTKTNSDNEMESLREELESQVEALAEKENEVADMKRRIPEMRDRLNQLEHKSCELDKSMLSMKSKIDNLHSKSLIDELF